MMTDLTRTYHRGIATITMHGNIAHRDVDVFRYYLDEALDRSASLVAIDLSDVDHIDSSVFGALISAHHRSVRSGSALTLVAPTAPVRRRLKQTHLDNVFPIVDEVPPAWDLPHTMDPTTDQAFEDLVDFIEARAQEDLHGTCRLCPQDAHLADVGAMAQDWVTRVRRANPNERQRAWSAWIAGIHRAHDEYPSFWDQLQTAPLP